MKLDAWSRNLFGKTWKNSAAETEKERKNGRTLFFVQRIVLLANNIAEFRLI